MNLKHRLALSLTLLITTQSLQAESRLAAALFLTSFGFIFSGMLVGAHAEYTAKSCLEESLLIPYNARNYNERKELLLEKYKDQEDIMQLAHNMFLVGFATAGFTFMLSILGDMSRNLNRTYSY